jgi:AcrR family transcriptional regulator
MARPNVRQKIVDAGLKILIERGFNGSGVQDITDAAGVPKGSFYNHFESKEALGAEVLKRYGLDNPRRPALADTSFAPPGTGAHGRSASWIGSCALVLFRGHNGIAEALSIPRRRCRMMTEDNQCNSDGPSGTHGAPARRRRLSRSVPIGVADKALRAHGAGHARDIRAVAFA